MQAVGLGPTHKVSSTIAVARGASTRPAPIMPARSGTGSRSAVVSAHVRNSYAVPVDGYELSRAAHRQFRYASVAARRAT